MSNIKILHPDYVTQFQCIGSECINNCCSNWNIIIDDKTYKKYKNSNHPLLKGKHKELFIRDDKNTYIKLREDGFCPLLNDNKLCSMHAELGHKSLADVCKIYPRVCKIIDGERELSLSTSCEAAAKLILEKKDGISFTYKDLDLPLDRPNVYNINQEQLIGRNFWGIRTLFIQILQHKDITLNKRLMLIVTIINVLKDLDSDEQVENLIQSVELSLENNQYTNILDEQTEENKENLFDRYASIVLFLDKKIISTAPTHSKSLIKHDPDSLVLEYNTYKNVYYTKCLDFIDKHEYILENYLVNTFFNMNQIFNTADDLEFIFLNLIGKIALIKHVITKFLMKHNDITCDEVYLIIAELSKITDHSVSTNETFVKTLSENNNTTNNIVSILAI